MQKILDIFSILQTDWIDDPLNAVGPWLPKRQYRIVGPSWACWLAVKADRLEKKFGNKIWYLFGPMLMRSGLHIEIQDKA